MARRARTYEPLPDWRDRAAAKAWPQQDIDLLATLVEAGEWVCEVTRDHALYTATAVHTIAAADGSRGRTLVQRGVRRFRVQRPPATVAGGRTSEAPYAGPFSQRVRHAGVRYVAASPGAHAWCPGHGPWCDRDEHGCGARRLVTLVTCGCPTDRWSLVREGGKVVFRHKKGCDLYEPQRRKDYTPVESPQVARTVEARPKAQEAPARRAAPAKKTRVLPGQIKLF